MSIITGTNSMEYLDAKEMEFKPTSLEQMLSTIEYMRHELGEVYDAYEYTIHPADFYAPGGMGFTPGIVWWPRLDNKKGVTHFFEKLGYTVRVELSETPPVITNKEKV